TPRVSVVLRAARALVMTKVAWPVVERKVSVPVVLAAAKRYWAELPSRVIWPTVMGAARVMVEVGEETPVWKTAASSGALGRMVQWEGSVQPPEPPFHKPTAGEAEREARASAAAARREVRDQER